MSIVEEGNSMESDHKYRAIANASLVYTAGGGETSIHIKRGSHKFPER